MASHESLQPLPVIRNRSKTRASCYGYAVLLVAALISELLAEPGQPYIRKPELGSTESLLIGYGVKLDTPSVALALTHKKSAVRELAAMLLAERADPSTLPHLKAALDDADPRVRIAVATALLRLGDHGVIEIPRQYLDDTDELQQIKAAAALCQVENPRAYEILQRSLTDSVGHARWLAAAGVRDCITFPGRQLEIEKLLAESDVNMRGIAIEGLTKTGSVEAVELLLGTLEHEDAYTRRMADQALWKLSGKDMDFVAYRPEKLRKEAIERWRNWWEEARPTWKPPEQRP